MPQRPRVSIAFGGGLDRYSGTTVAQATAFRDLRNVHLRRGGAELRGGLGLVNALGGDALIGIFSIRSQGIGALVTYTIATRQVKLYLTSSDGSVTSLVGVVWTLGVDAGFPRVLGAEFIDKLVLAHDEPIYAKRQVTKVYDPGAGTITNLQADLYLPTEPPTLVDVKFRGVMAYLDYLFGWGYGSENVGDDNRPEIVRSSKPGELAFVAEHYFRAGSQGDPVLMCAQAGQELMVRKPSNSYRIVGYDRATFGIFPGDRFFGLAGSQLSITIAGVNYFWSLDGPRRSEGGVQSEDLGLPLDLAGPTPSALAASADLAYGFAVYRSEKREIEFIFGRWGYVYHMAEEGEERWSFREYAVQLASGGVLYDATSSAGSGTIGTPAYPVIGAVTADAPAAGSATVHAAYVTTNGPLLGGEVVELWAKSRYGSDAWARIATAAADPVGSSIAGPVTREGITFDVAVRFTYLGIPTAGYTSGNPFDWPATARGSVQTAVEPPTLANPVWSRASAVAHGFTFDRTGGAAVAAHGELQEVLEYSSNGGASWTPVAAAALSANPSYLGLGNAIVGMDIQWRAKDVSGEGISSAYSGVVTEWAGPVALDPFSLVFSDPMILAGLYQLDWAWPAGADDTWGLEVIGHSAAGNGTTKIESYATIRDFPDAPCAGPGPDVFANTRTFRTQFGVTDYSFVIASNGVPGNC
jgi:hypothetical protein